MEIPIEQPKQNDVFSYGFDRSLNKIKTEQSLPKNKIEVAVRDVLLQSGIDINTVNNISSGNFNRGDFHWFTLFESIDAYTKTLVGAGTSITLSWSAVTLSTGGANNDRAELIKGAYSGDISWNNQRKFRTRINNTNNTAQAIYIVTGLASNGNDTARHFGFKIVNNTIYGTNADGGTQNIISLQTIGAGEVHSLEARYFPAEKVEFCVDGILKGTSINNMPAGVSESDYIVDIEIKATEVAVKTIAFGYWDFWQAV